MMSNQFRVGVYGASGYAGLDLVDILLDHPAANLVFATSSTYQGDPVPRTDLRYITPEDVKLDTVDVVFLALPHKASAVVAAQALKEGVKVIDLSADLRLDTASSYEKWYQTEHPHPELLPVPYGLPEINRDKLRDVNAIAVPGCYPTASLLGLYPLLRIKGVEPTSPIIIDAKSGTSGAGRSPKVNMLFAEIYGNLIPYSTGRSHRHVGEIEQEIEKVAGYGCQIIFTPHVVPVARGLMASIYVTLNYNITSDKVHSLYNNVYADEPLVNLLPPGQQATFRDAALSNHCSISLTPVDSQHLHITSVIDNLRKGAASQAVQDFNLMFGLPETQGLL